MVYKTETYYSFSSDRTAVEMDEGINDMAESGWEPVSISVINDDKRITAFVTYHKL